METPRTYSPTDTLIEFVREKNLHEVLIVWPTGSGKTNATMALAYDYFERNEINFLMVLVLKQNLTRNLESEVGKFFPKNCYKVSSMYSFTYDIKNNPNTMRLLVSKRVGFVVDEIDQIIPRAMDTRQRQREEDKPKHWKMKYFEMLRRIWNVGICSTTRVLMLATATPFVNNIDKELQNYYKLMYRDVYENMEFVGNYRAFVMDRVHALPSVAVEHYYKCTVKYQTNSLECVPRPHPLYVPFCLEPSLKVKRMHEANEDDLNALFPANEADNVKLRTLVNIIRESKERTFVMCYLIETQNKVCQALENHHISYKKVYSAMSVRAQLAALRDFDANLNLQVLVATEFLNSGVSIKNVVQVHILEPFIMYEPTTTIQSAGRCVRINSHSQSGTIVRIWLYVLNGTREVDRYTTAMQKQNTFERFMDAVHANNAPFFRRFPISVALKPLRAGTVVQIVENTEDDGDLLGTSSNVLLSSEAFSDKSLATFYAQCMKEPEARGGMHFVYGAVLRTYDQLHDFSDCPYKMDLKRGDDILERERAFERAILADGGTDQSLAWILVSGTCRYNLRRHVIEKKDRDAFRTAFKNNPATARLKQSILKGAMFVNQHLRDMAKSMNIQIPEYVFSLKKKEKEELVCNIIYEESISRGVHVSQLTGGECIPGDAVDKLSS